VHCECGCGYEGEDLVTQYLVEEACMVALDAHESRMIADQARDDATSAAETRVAQTLAELRKRDR
jgi:hypothetical protein